MTASIPLAWLGTYLVHSTILLGAAWAVSHWLRRRSSGRSLALEEGLWKTGLVGGLVTATLQVGMAFVPAPGLPLPATLSPAPSTVGAVTAVATTDPVTPAAEPGLGSALARTSGPHPILEAPEALLPGWQRLVLGVWILGAILGLGSLVLAWFRLRRTLRGRSEVSSGAIRSALDRLIASVRGRKDVRLTGSERLPVPVALGVLEREICVPRRVIDSFGPREQEGLLAHELAHLERRDPAWLLAARAIEGGLFLQPLNRLARARLREIAEYRCDTWAVERTGDRVGLARCLTEVAEWMTGLEPVPLLDPAPGMAPGMAGDRRTLGRRVRRILSEGTGEAGGGRSGGRWGFGFAAAALLIIGCIAPGVAPAVSTEASPAAAADAERQAAESTDTAESAERAEWVEAQEARERAEMAERAERAEATERAERAEHDPDLDAEPDWDWDPDLDLDVEMSRELEMRIESLTRMAEEMAEQWAPDPTDLEALEAIEREIERVVERSMEAHEEALEELEQRMSEELEGIEDFDDLEPEERARIEAQMRRLGEEARRIAERAQPDQEVLARLHERALRIAEESRPDPEEMERMNREVERLNREIEQITRRELRRVGEELDRNRVVLERQIREETREEVRHALEQARAELEVHRNELEEARQELAADMEEAREEHRRELQERRQELGEQHRELEERRRELEERHREHLEEEAREAEEPPAA